MRRVTDLAIPLGTLILALLLPSLYKNQLLLFNTLTYLILAQGVNLLYGFTGYLPFGYVGFFGTGAYGAAVAILLWNLPVALAIGLGAVLALVLGVLLAPLLRLSGAYFAIASLAASQAVYYVVANPDLAGITRGPYGVSLESAYAPAASYVAMALLLTATTALTLFLRRSRFGLLLRAVRDDPVSAASAGVDVVRHRIVAWLLSALIAGLAGAIFAWQISVFYPDTVFDLSVSIFAIVFTLFGGSGTLLGPIFGTLALYGLYNAIGISEPQYFQLIYGLLIVVLVLFLPNGLASLLERRGIRVL